MEPLLYQPSPFPFQAIPARSLVLVSTPHLVPQLGAARFSALQRQVMWYAPAEDEDFIADSGLREGTELRKQVTTGWLK